jgi:hypothetical protein
MLLCTRVHAGRVTCVLLAFFTLLLFISGCSGGDSNPPSSSTSPNSPNSPTSPSNGAGVLQAYVKPSNTTLWPNLLAFGQSVALDGDTLAVGVVDPSCASGVNGNPMDSRCFNAGAVYVFARTGGTWSQQAYLKPSNTQGGESFGTGVSLSGDTLAVAAPGVGRGVYVFTRTGSTWIQQAFVKAPNTVPGTFGTVVALSGNTLAVSATDQSCATGINGNPADTGCGSGAVYVFTRSNDAWTQEAYVKASNNRVGVFFGFGRHLTLDGDTLAVGDELEGSCSTGINGDQFNNSCLEAGAVYVFTRTAGVWTQQAYVKASNTNTVFAGGAFGISLALKGDTLIVGATGDRSCATGINGNQADNGCPGAGAVYIFTRTNNLWSQTAYVKALPPNGMSFGIFGNSLGGVFGSSLAFDGTTLAVGAGDNNCATGFNPLPGSNDCGGSGAVYLFSRTATSWAQRAYVKASNTDVGDAFGANLVPFRLAGSIQSSVAISGNTLAVGAIGEDSCATGINGNQTDNSCGPNSSPEFQTAGGSGAAYVYVLQ